jgi:hypothetical protein
MQFDQLKWRQFITLLGGAAAWPLAAQAQQSAKVSRIGYLGLGPNAPASAWAARVEVLRAGLRDLGWIEGKNIVIEFRWADNVDELPALAAALVRLPVDVIFASSSTQVEAARPDARRMFECLLAYARREGRRRSEPGQRGTELQKSGRARTLPRMRRQSILEWQLYRESTTRTTAGSTRLRSWRG